MKAVFDEMRRDRPRARFTVGIHDDVTHASLPVERDFDIEPPATVRAIFYGLGSDGTVGANKASRPRERRTRSTRTASTGAIRSTTGAQTAPRGTAGGSSDSGGRSSSST